MATSCHVTSRSAATAHARHLSSQTSQLHCQLTLFTFSADVTQDDNNFTLIYTRVMLLDLHPVSTLRTKVKSPAARIPSNVYVADDIEIHCAAVFNFRAAFFVMCAAAQLRRNIANGPKNKNNDKMTQFRLHFIRMKNRFMQLTMLDFNSPHLWPSSIAYQLR